MDGQQRIRTLHGALAEPGDEYDESLASHEIADDEGGDDDEGEAEGRTVWCLNLGALPEFKGEFPAAERFKLFRKVRDPLQEDATQPAALQVDRRALIPLKWVLGRSDEDLRRDASLKEVARTIGPALDHVLSHRHILREAARHLDCRGVHGLVSPTKTDAASSHGNLQTRINWQENE